jgi:hypothetical protein
MQGIAEAVYMNAELRLEEEDERKTVPSSSSCKTPKELFTAEQALLILAKAMKAFEQPDLESNEIMRRMVWQLRAGSINASLGSMPVIGGLKRNRWS